jgi:hypothetical protein
VLAEARANGGRVLVTREAAAERGGGAAARQVVDVYEPVAGAEAVQTPKQVGRGMGSAVLCCRQRCCGRGAGVSVSKGLQAGADPPSHAHTIHPCCAEAQPHPTLCCAPLSPHPPPPPPPRCMRACRLRATA